MWWGSSLLSGHLCPIGMGSDPKLPEQKPLAPTDSVPFVSVFFPFSAVGPPTSLITARKCWSQWGSCQSQTEVRVVSDELSLQGSIFASLIWVSPSLSPVSSTMLWSHLQQHHLLYCRASRVVWTLDMYWQVSCGGVAAVRNLGCVYCASWVITNNGCYCLTPGDWPQGTGDWFASASQSLLSVCGHCRSSTVLWCGVSRASVFTQLGLGMCQGSCLQPGSG